MLLSPLPPSRESWVRVFFFDLPAHGSKKKTLTSHSLTRAGPSSPAKAGEG